MTSYFESTSSALAESIAATAAVVQQYKQAFARLEEGRKSQAAEIDRLQEAIAKCEGRSSSPLHVYVPFSELFVSELAQLQTLNPTQMTDAIGAAAKVFEVYGAILGRLREIQAKQAEELAALSETLRTATNPFHHASPELMAICEGNLQMLLEAKPVTAIPASKLLNTLLFCRPEEAKAIYNLALFIANANPELLHKETPLYEKLRDWMMTRASHEESLIKERDLLVVSLGQMPNHAPRDLVAPLEVLSNLQILICDIQKNPVSNARALFEKPEKNRAEELFCSLVQRRLEEIQEVPQLEDPETCQGSLSLYDQLCIDPQYNVRLAGAQGIGVRWKENLNTRNGLITTCIMSCCDVAVLQEAAAKPRPEGDVEIKAQLPQMEMSLVESLAKEASEGPIQKCEEIEAEIYNICSELTGLKSEDPSQFAKQFCNLFATGGLSPSFYQIISQGDGKYALYLSHLVYYHQAISHRKKGFEEFASHYEWEWLIGGQLPPLEAACRMQTLVQSFHRDPNFLGSAMVPKQVRWASHLCDLMTTGKISPIYSDAGSGKTSTAIFTMRLLQKAMPDICQNKDVHLVSPFYTRVQGLECHQLINPSGIFYIDVADDAHLQDVVLVDEAHILDPDIKIVLRSPSGKEREVEPLPMTATPIIPSDAYEPFRKDLHKHLETQYKIYARNYELSKAAFDEKKAAVALEKSREIGRGLHKNSQSYLAYLQYLPRAQRDYFTKHLDALSGNFSDDDIETLLVTMNWFLRAGEKGESIYGTELLHIVRAKIPSGFNPLQSLQKKEFATACKLFQELEKRLKTIKAIRRGGLSELPAELQETGVILEKMDRDLSELKSKLEKWERQDSLPPVDSGDEILRTLPAKRVAKFKTTAYERKELKVFSGESAAEMIAELPMPPQPVIQLIYPGVRFTTENFSDLVLKLHDVMAPRYPGKDLFFVYQDSHSADGKKGEKWAVRVADGNLTFTPAPQNIDPATQTAVLLYDTTNKQGGDFNSLSRVADRFEIAQFLFYNLTNDTDPLGHTSANDLYQALARRRGVSQITSTVIGTSEEAVFFNTVNSRQWTLEKSWGARNAASRVAKKMLKAYGQKAIPQEMPALRHRTLDVVQSTISRSIRGLEGVHMIDALRKGILAMTSDEASQPRALIQHVSSEPLKTLMHEALSDETLDDIKRSTEVHGADAAALWRVKKLQREIAFLTQSAVRYQPDTGN